MPTDTKQRTPSPMAIRATEAIRKHLEAFPGCSGQCPDIAEIIDQETGAPDLLEACKQIVWKLNHNHGDSKSNKTWPATITRNDATVRIAKDAIAQATVTGR